MVRSRGKRLERHFPHPNPTFGTKGKQKTPSAWRRSVYYWWWEYLRRSEDYRRTCKKGGKGKCAAIYEDFGDVFALDFKTWWSTGDRGAVLFAEPPTPTIQVIREVIVRKGTDDKSLVLEVPLNLPITHLVKRFREVVSKHHSGRRGVKVSARTKAKYPVASGRIDVQFLQIALQVWDARRAQPDKALWELATDLRLSPAHAILEPDSPQIRYDKKNNLAATASRYIRRANAIIGAVGRGLFPVPESRAKRTG